MSVEVLPEAVQHHRKPSHPSISAMLSRVLLVLIALLLIEVLLEAWMQVLFGHDGPDGEFVPAAWPKQLKNGLFLTLLAVSVLKISVDRSWDRFRTSADLAIVALGVALLAAGLFGGVSLVLIAKAGYVYLRGAIVFYAWRALNPSRRGVKRALWVAGGVILAGAIAAIIQMIVGFRSYIWFQWEDLTWAMINRAQGLLDHPNDVGHVTGLMLLGLIAWFVTQERVRAYWWVLFIVIAAALGASQSRESLLAVFAGLVVLAYLRRGRFRVVLAGMLTVVVLGALPVIVSAEHRAEWARRLAGVTAAIEVPSGTVPHANGATPSPDPDAPNDDAQDIPDREIRVLYLQQGAALWADRPLLGYGVGTFGGFVAFDNDPLWNEHPRFEPDGFDMYGFAAKTVDSFWLHLTVETGLIGVLAYLGWLWLLCRPLLRSAREALRRQKTDPGAQSWAHPAVYWALASMTFAVLVAFLSPSLEDPLFPALLFSVLGIGWISLTWMRQRQENIDDRGAL